MPESGEAQGFFVGLFSDRQRADRPSPGGFPEKMGLQPDGVPRVGLRSVKLQVRSFGRICDHQRDRLHSRRQDRSGEGSRRAYRGSTCPLTAEAAGCGAHTRSPSSRPGVCRGGQRCPDRSAGSILDGSPGRRRTLRNARAAADESEVGTTASTLTIAGLSKW